MAGHTSSLAFRRMQPLPGMVISSEEAKAVSTGQGPAAALGVHRRRMLGLHVHLRYPVSFCPDPADFQATGERFFDHPAQVVFGEESADDARRRFANAVEAVMRRQSEEAVAIVAHGTVISLLVAHAGNSEPTAALEEPGLPGHPDPGLALIAAAGTFGLGRAYRVAGGSIYGTDDICNRGRVAGHGYAAGRGQKCAAGL